jgi:hypothetical protein
MEDFFLVFKSFSFTQLQGLKKKFFSQIIFLAFYQNISKIKELKKYFSRDLSSQLIVIQLNLFGLFIGKFITEDSHERDIPHLYIIPCLMLTYISPPIGYVFYFILKRLK